MKNYYEILKLDSGCSFSEIKNNYRQLCKKYHPDKNNGDDTLFKELKEAYDVLSDELKRQDYDFEFSDGYIPKNINIKHTINIPLMDCYNGCERKVKLGGEIHTIPIPPHTLPHSSIIIKGKGWNGGDLELEVNIPKEDDLWIDEKMNTHIIKNINLWDGLLGCKTDVDVFNQHLTCDVKPYTCKEATTVFLEKGYPIGERRGILIVEIKVIPPNTLNDEQINLVKQIKELNGES